MCGIVGGVSNKNITPLLLEGLNLLEYRGYDSSGLIVLTKNNTFDRTRSVGKVKNLEDSLKKRKSKQIHAKHLSQLDTETLTPAPIVEDKDTHFIYLPLLDEEIGRAHV